MILDLTMISQMTPKAHVIKVKMDKWNNSKLKTAQQRKQSVE